MKLLSLYSGAGLLDLGFLLNGFEIVEACEFNPKFTRCYFEAINRRLNYDIYLKESHDLSDVLTQTRLGKKYYGIDGIIGGPPCQDFSVMGKNEGINGKNGSQVFNYLNIVRLTNPKFIFFENVKGLYSTIKHRETLYYILNELKNLGYKVEYKIINAIEYGVPQFRERIFIIGFKSEKLTKEFKWPEKTHPDYKLIEWPRPWEFGNDYIKPNNITGKYEQLTVEYTIKDAIGKPNGDEYFLPKSSRFNQIMEGDVARQSYKRLHRFKYSPTVAYGNNEVHLHPTEVRRLSVREALRIQSVPDNYVMPKELDLTAKFKMISNGVPTKLASIFAEAIMEYIIEQSL